MAHRHVNRKRLISHYAALTNTLFLLPGIALLPAPARAQADADTDADRLRNQIVTRLSGGVPLPGGATFTVKSLAVTVVVLPEEQYAVRLSGVVANAAQRTALLRFVQSQKFTGVAGKNISVSAIQVTANEPPPTAEEVTNAYRIALKDLAGPITFEAIPLPGGKRSLIVQGTFEKKPGGASDLDAARRRIAAVYLPFGWSITDLLKEKDKPADNSSLDLETLVAGLIHNDSVKVTAQKLPGERFAVHLDPVDGTPPLMQAEVDRVLAAAKTARPEAEKDKLLVYNHLKTVASIERTHTLRYLRSGLVSTPGKNEKYAGPDIATIGTDEAATAMATFLESIYPEGVKVSAQENRLVLRGEPDKVQRLRQLLALNLDVPSPLVRADVFTIQVNSTSNGIERDRAQAKMDQIRAGVQITRDLLQGSQYALMEYVQAHAGDISNFFHHHRVKDSNGQYGPEHNHEDLERKMAKAGFDTNPLRPLSVNETLVFLMFVDREQLQKDLAPVFNDALKSTEPHLTYALVRSLQDIRKLLLTRPTPNGSPVLPPKMSWRLPKSSAERESLVGLIDRMLVLVDVSGQVHEKYNGKHQARQYVMDRLAKNMDPKTQEAEARATEAFLDTWLECMKASQGDSVGPSADYLATKLVASSAATDLLLKQSMDAVTADLQDLFFQPLLGWIRDEVQKGGARASGVDLVGATSIVVRDRTLAENVGEAEAFAAFTPIPKIGEDLLKSAQTLSEGTGEQAVAEKIARDRSGEIITDAAGNPVKLAAGQALEFDADGKVIRNADGSPVLLSVPKAAKPLTALGALNPAQALLLQTVLSVDAAKPVYRSVAPGTSLSLRPFVLPGGGSARVQINLSTTIGVSPDEMAAAAEAGGPVDRIKSHTVVTEATISALDLVEVSTFGAQTTQPGAYTWNIPLLSSVPILGDLFHGPRSRETHRQDSIALVNLTILPRSLDLVPSYNPDATPDTLTPVPAAESKEPKKQ